MSGRCCEYSAASDDDDERNLETAGAILSRLDGGGSMWFNVKGAIARARESRHWCIRIRRSKEEYAHTILVQFYEFWF